MSTVKISQLVPLFVLNSNTANTIFAVVDLTTGITNKISGTTLAKGLYANNQLNVGNNSVILPNVIAQFAGSSTLYEQINLFNTDANGTADYIITGDTGTDITNYLDVGFINSSYSNTSPYNSLGTSIEPLSGYVYVKGGVNSGGNLVLGTVNPGTELRFLVGGINSTNVSVKVTENSLTLQNQTNLIFKDSTIQTTAASPVAYTQAAFNQANSGVTKADTAQLVAQAGYNQSNVTIGVDVTQNLSIQAAFTIANNALANTTGTFAGNLTVTGNVITNSVSTPNTTINNGILTSSSITANAGFILNGLGVYSYTTSNNTTATQITKKSTAVYSNGRTGQITTNSAVLSKGDSVQFTVYNSQIVSGKDVIILNIASGATISSYQVSVCSVSIGSFDVCITNNGSGPLSETLTLNYAILRVK